MATEEKESQIPMPSWKEQGYIPLRYVMMVLTSSGLFLNGGLWININFAILTMVSSSGSNSTNDSDITQTPCGFNVTQDAQSEYEGDFDWDDWTQGLILGAFYWGYIWTQLPGGYLTEIVGGRYMFGGTIALQAIMNLLMPLAANGGSTLLIIARVLMGFLGGPVYPSMNAFISCWFPPQERTTLTTIVYTGNTLSLLFIYSIIAVIIKSMGWEAAFYVPGAVTLVWCIVWFIVASDSPHNHRWITSAEKDYIISSLGEAKLVKRPPVPWKGILTSVPFWALVIAMFGDLWGYFLLLANLPLYMKEMMGENLSANALWSSLPNLGAMVVSLAAAAIVDVMVRRQTLSRGILRKGIHFLGQATQGICMLTLSFLMCDQTTARWVFVVSQSFSGLALPGYLANFMDLAPNFTGTIYGIANAIGTTTGWLAPMTTGLLINNQQTLGQWQKIWYVAAGMFLGNLVIYLIFGSGEVQPWNYVQDEQLVLTEESHGSKGNNSNKNKHYQGTDFDHSNSDLPSSNAANTSSNQARINYAFEDT